MYCRHPDRPPTRTETRLRLPVTQIFLHFGPAARIVRVVGRYDYPYYSREADTHMRTNADRARRACYLAVIMAEPVQIALQEKYGVRLADVRTLRTLRDLGCVPISQFAAAFGISRSTATGVIDRFEERGLVERVTSATDRRSTLVRLTARGLAALEDRAIYREGPLSHRIEQLSEAQQGQLADLLELLIGPDESPRSSEVEEATERAFVH